MTETSQRAAWAPFAHLMCLTHNLQQTSRGKMKDPEDFTPFQAPIRELQPGQRIL